MHLASVPDARALLMLGHGAGGGVQAPDIQAAAIAALEEGVSIALVEQPYRVAGRRSPAPAAQLDAAWEAVARELAQPTLIVGGRSSGARVACRSATAVGAVGVLCLAFPLQPPARRSGAPPPNRLDELKLPKVPVLVVQGENDAFGMPPRGRGRKVVRIAGDHGLKRDHDKLRKAVRAWLRSLDL